MGARLAAGQVHGTAGFCDPAFAANRDEPVHRWTGWVAGFSKHFAADAISRFAGDADTVLDPFAGVGTTLVEADLAGCRTAGFEINPYARLVSAVKLKSYMTDTDLLRRTAAEFVRFMDSAGAPVSRPPEGFRTRSPFYSPPVERKALQVMDFIGMQEGRQVADAFRLAFASLMVGFSNYSYEPSLGRRAAAGRPDVADFDVAGAVAAKVNLMADDMDWYAASRAGGRSRRGPGTVSEESFLEGGGAIGNSSVDLIVTSPPYLNNYHYIRNTRPHMYWLGLCASASETRRAEAMNFGTYWQNARYMDAVDLDASISDPDIRGTLERIGSKHPDRGAYGGRGWANYAALYLNDCLRFARAARRCLRRGGTAIIVIGNSILQGVDVPTDRFLASISEDAGMETIGIHTPRHVRTGSSIVGSSVRAAAGSGRLYESVVEMRKT